MRIKTTLWLAAVAALLVANRAAQAALTVRVNINVADNALQVGQTTNASATALVEGAAADEGIFTYDLDAILSDSAVLQVVPGSVTRVGNDAVLGGSDGTVGPSGIDAVAGGFLDTNVGVGSAATLFTFQLRAVGAGVATVTPGPDTSVYGSDFTLYSTQQFDVVYELGSTVNVRPGQPTGAVPEPITAGLWGLSLFAAALAFSRRPVRQLAMRRV